MDPRKRVMRFASLIRKERKQSESPEVSHQSTSAARSEQIRPPSIPEETTPSVIEPIEASGDKKRKGTEAVYKGRRKKLFPADPERMLLSTTGSEDAKLVVLEHETRSKELAEGKIFVNWADSLAWEILWIGYVWGVPFAIEESLMDFYEYMWYPRYTKGVGLGYGNPDAIDIDVIGTEQPRHPVAQLGQHFVAESSQSKSLEAGSTERLLTSLVDFLGAEKAFGETDSISDGLSQRRASLDSLIAESAPPLLLLTGAEEPEVEELATAEATEPVIEKISIAEAKEPIIEEATIAETIEPVIVAGDEDPTIPASFTASTELNKMICSEGVGTSAGVPAEMEAQGAEPINLTEEFIATEVTPGEGSDSTEEPRINISVTQLERFMERYMMKRLNNNWSLEAYKKKMDDCVTRSFENKEAISRIDQTLGEFGDLLKIMQKDISDLKEGATAQTAVSVNLRKDIDLSIAGHNSLTTQVNRLHESSEKSLAESLSVQGSLHRVCAESATQWSRHDVDHVGISARLSGLEELRRLDNVSRGQEKVTDFFSIKMGGFQECLEVQIAHGFFDRRILNNAKFMNLVKDKDALLAKLAEKDKEIPWRGGQGKK